MSDQTPEQPQPSPKHPDVPPEQQALVGLENVLADFARTFEDIALRWERLIYPAVILFGLMGLSGFYLIYSLTEDMHALAKNIDPLMAQNMGAISGNIATLAGDIETMNADIRKMTSSIGNMTTNIAHMDTTISTMGTNIATISVQLNSLEPIRVTMDEMNDSMHGMTTNMATMTRNMSQMNYTYGRPMSFMNQFMPW